VSTEKRFRYEINVGEKDPLARDVAFNRDSFERNERKSPYDNGTVQVGTNEIKVRLVQPIAEQAAAALLGIMESSTFGLSDEEVADRMDAAASVSPDATSEMFQGGLQGALDTQWIAFAVSGVSRACTHQLVRTSRAKFHQQSQRTVDLGEHPEFRCPESIWEANDDVWRAWVKAVAAAHEAYHLAVKEDVSYQDARYILPEGTTTFIICAYSIREFQAVYSYRACPMFQWEICRVHRMMKDELVAEHPWLEPHIKISCERTHGALDEGHSVRSTELPPRGAYDHHCTFQGWEQVEGQCDKPYARESNRAFKSKVHSIKREKEG
jgi:thymidylate synthase (FAD)